MKVLENVCSRVYILKRPGAPEVSILFSRGSEVLEVTAFCGRRDGERRKQCVMCMCGRR